MGLPEMIAAVLAVMVLITMAGLVIVALVERIKEINNEAKRYKVASTT